MTSSSVNRGAEIGASLQQQVEQQAASRARKYGTFDGVFVPTLLTILGVIMYLRLGWVVGTTGLLGAWLIIALAVAITATTALSMSSMVTNIRIGAGGAFSIISQSLGLEVGGAVGIPLYLSQALVVALYVFGFRAGWLRLFPGHSPLAVDLSVFAVLFVLTYMSANLSFRVQYVILIVVVASLVSVFGSVLTTGARHVPLLWVGRTGDAGTGPPFWSVFAVFFPATTGILAGANMSGELKNPRRSIPAGTMAAVALSGALYFALALWLAWTASPAELVGQYTIMLDKALYEPVVLAGLLGATFSSGLASLVGAPRVLQALTVHNVLPGRRWLARVGANGEPRNALAATGAIVVAALMLRDLDVVAPLITMFFLIAYAMIDVVVFIEQSLGLVSFRPLLKLPRMVPLLGAVGSVAAMFIISPVFGLVGVALVVAAFSVLLRRRLSAPFGDVRSGLFVALAEWAAKRASRLGTSQERAWQPNLLVPVVDPASLDGCRELLRDLSSARGSIKLVGLSRSCDGPGRSMGRDLLAMARRFRGEGVFTTWTQIDDETFSRGLTSGIQVLSGVFFRPNVVFLRLPAEGEDPPDEALATVIAEARRQQMGVMLFADGPGASLGATYAVNVWLRDQGPDWRLSMHLGNIDLALLAAYILKGRRRGLINVLTVVADADQVPAAEVYLRNLVDLARIPDVRVHVDWGGFEDHVRRAPPADLTLMGLPDVLDFAFARRMVAITASACLFVRDSGLENVLA
ncbi:MAG: amino acid permease [Anaerolineae bacterium]